MINYIYLQNKNVAAEIQWALTEATSSHVGDDCLHMTRCMLIICVKI